MHGTPTDRIGARAQRQDNGEWYVRIFGPHDVLRRLAEDLDIRWFQSACVEAIRCAPSSSWP